MRCPPLLKRHYGMQMMARLARMIHAAGNSCGYRYFLAMPPLMLDRPADSVTLEVPSTIFATVRAPDVSLRRGPDESSRAPTTEPPQPTDTAALPCPGGCFGQDRAFYGSSECLAWRLLLRLLGATAGWYAHRSDAAHARGSDREFRPGDALHRARRACPQRALRRRPHRLRRRNREVPSHPSPRPLVELKGSWQFSGLVISQNRGREGFAGGRGGA